MAFYEAVDQLQNVITYIDNAVAGIWTKSGTGYPYTYTRTTSSGISISFQVAAIGNGYVQFVFNGNNYYVHVGSTGVTNSHYFRIICSDSVFFFWMNGPGAGNTGAYNSTYGSGTGYFLVTTFTPYYLTDNNTSNQVVALSSHSNTSVTSFSYVGYVKTGLNNLSNAAAEFATVRPAVQDIAAVGDLIPNNSALSNIIYWPFIIIEQSDGIRGRLDNIYFASDYNASLAGDTGAANYAATSSIIIDGDTYYLTGGVYLPLTNSYAPLGTSGIPNTTVNGAGGPYFMVRG